jgi:hypothetical protein
MAAMFYIHCLDYTYWCTITLIDWVRVLMFNATLNNISLIWRSVLLVEETRENYRPAASHCQTLWIDWLMFSATLAVFQLYRVAWSWLHTISRRKSFIISIISDIMKNDTFFRKLNLLTLLTCSTFKHLCTTTLTGVWV